MRVEHKESPARQSILLLEDDEALRRGLVDLFIFHGYEVDAAATVEAARRLIGTKVYDVAILDWMLPDGDGVSVGKQLRSHDPECTLLFLTARSAEADRVQGLSLGADDYVTKPFSSRELVLRVQNILRRTQKNLTAENLIRCSGIEIDTLRRIVHRPGDAVSTQLSKRELEILLYLHSCAPRAVSRGDILRNVWGYSRSMKIETRTVDIHIAKLRKKVERDPGHPSLILTERGDGYRLEVEP